jgi:hypothetical protein
MIPRKILKKIRQIELRTNRIVSGSSRRGQVRIPTGFRPTAQGCEERATLGRHRTDITSRNAVAAVLGSYISRDVCHNPVGVVVNFVPPTQGSSCVATLGWMTQSLWDWLNAQTHLERRNQLVLSSALTCVLSPRRGFQPSMLSDFSAARSNHPVAGISQSAGSVSPSPWGEGRDEGERKTNFSGSHFTRRTPRLRIPTGFRPIAQGCEERATLGHRRTNISNRNAVAAVPVSSCSRDVCHNPVGVAGNFIPPTQGSSCVATLCWMTQSLWDWFHAQPHASRQP